MNKSKATEYGCIDFLMRNCIEPASRAFLRIEHHCSVKGIPGLRQRLPSSATLSGRIWLSLFALFSLSRCTDVRINCVTSTGKDMLKEAIAKIVTGQHLDEQQMTDVMHKIMSNQDNIEILSGQ